MNCHNFGQFEAWWIKFLHYGFMNMLNVIINYDLSEFLRVLLFLPNNGTNSALNYQRYSIALSTRGPNVIIQQPRTFVLRCLNARNTHVGFLLQASSVPLTKVAEISMKLIFFYRYTCQSGIFSGLTSAPRPFIS